ncbi:MAG: hypothetical protein FJ135_12220 [Deltaproteobacteria bacterium]|nr:hypothetical protein [Deltaproteobacteria bacterium]
MDHQQIGNNDCDTSSILITDAKQALQKVLEAYGEDVATQVFGSVVADARCRTFCHLQGVKQIHCGAYLEKMKGKKRPAVPKIPPAMDHGTLWGKDGKTPSLFVSQPYKLAHNHLRQVMDFCEANGLEVEIAGWPSWWKPGMALTVIFKTKEDTVSVEDIVGGNGNT